MLLEKLKNVIMAQIMSNFTIVSELIKEKIKLIKIFLFGFIWRIKSYKNI